MEPGSKVRVRANPQRVGTVTNETDGHGDRKRLLIDFPDGEEFILAASLEKVERKDLQGPDALVRQGRYGRVGDLRCASVRRGIRRKTRSAAIEQRANWLW